MNQDVIINRLAHIAGVSRKQVLDTLRKMSSIPEVRKEIERQYDKKGRKKTSKGST